MDERFYSSRRQFLKTAVAVGGASAFAACLDRSEADVPQGPDDTSELPERQHAWNEFLDTDDHGNHELPRHHVLLLLEYVGTDVTADRQQVEEALSTLDTAYVRGNNGLLHTIGYSPNYFDRFDDDLPNTVDLPESTPMASFENPDLDTADALVHLASDHAEVVLGAEQALTGELEELNGRPVSASFDGVFEVAQRRTGFRGTGMPADRQDEVDNVPESNPVPEDSPLFMGFKSGMRGNQATEDRVTVAAGPFEGATTTHLSRIRLELDDWYGQNTREERVAKMFCPVHAEEDRVEGAGDNLGADSGVGGCPTHMGRDAREGVVGHGQKAADARTDGRPLLLRRDFPSTDDNEAGLHFLSHQQGIGNFTKVRTAMNASHLGEGTAVGQRTNNGILEFMTVRNRANFLVPPRRHRALPPANP